MSRNVFTFLSANFGNREFMLFLQATPSYQWDKKNRQESSRNTLALFLPVALLDTNLMIN